MKTNNPVIKEFWKTFLLKQNLPLDTPVYDVFYFGNTKSVANLCAQLVLDQKKKATSSLYKAYELENQPLPEVGNYSIVVDFDYHPVCIIQTTAISILAFDNMTFEICKREGEDDNLQSWVDHHHEFFTQDALDYGFTFTPDMDVLFEDFHLIYTYNQYIQDKEKMATTTIF